MQEKSEDFEASCIQLQRLNIANIFIFPFRDLMNWCHRVSKDFDVSSSASSMLVLQEALDCFVACLSKSDKRLPLAEAIGAKLNVTKVKVSLSVCLRQMHMSGISEFDIFFTQRNIFWTFHEKLYFQTCAPSNIIVNHMHTCIFS